MHLSVVVLPHPDGPRSTTKSPLPTSRETLSTATLFPNFLNRLLTLTLVIHVPKTLQLLLCLPESRSKLILRSVCRIVSVVLVHPGARLSEMRDDFLSVNLHGVLLVGARAVDDEICITGRDQLRQLLEVLLRVG